VADDYTLLNPGTGGDVMDEESVTYGSPPTTRKRARIELTGAAQAEVAQVKNAGQPGTAYGVITRPIQQCSTRTVTRVAASVTVVTLSAANASRTGLIVYNESPSPLFLKFGVSAATTDYTVQIPPSGYWVMDMPIDPGIITGIWTNAVGAAQVTEQA
jgi:hypothetical protein